MKMSAQTSKTGDIKLMALLVAKRLRQEHGCDAPPLFGDYSVVPNDRAYGPSFDLNVRVALGRGLSATVSASEWQANDQELDELVQLAGDISAAVADILDNASNVRAMLKEVTTATKREIVKANRRGLSHQLNSVALMPVEAGADEEKCVRVEHTALGRSLQEGEAFAFEATSVEDVVAAFAGIHDVQVRRSARREELNDIRATGTIDSVTVAALTNAGFDVPKILARLRHTDHLVVNAGSDDDSFFLYWDEGTIFANLNLAEGVRWQQDRLSFDNAPEAIDRLSVGSPLSQLQDLPFLDDRAAVLSKSGEAGQRATIRCSRALLAFDADSGRLWQV